MKAQNILSNSYTPREVKVLTPDWWATAHPTAWCWCAHCTTNEILSSANTDATARSQAIQTGFCTSASPVSSVAVLTNATNFMWRMSTDCAKYCCCSSFRLMTDALHMSVVTLLSHRYYDFQQCPEQKDSHLWFCSLDPHRGVINMTLHKHNLSHNECEVEFDHNYLLHLYLPS